LTSAAFGASSTRDRHRRYTLETFEAVCRSRTADDEGYEAQTVAELVRADERLKKEFPLITLPVLNLRGTADRAAKPHGSHVFHDTAGSEDKRRNR
jgi:hypothetical protein